MNTHRFFVEKLRFHLTDKKKLVFVGWFFDGSTRDHTLSAHLDGEDLPLALQINKGAEVRQKYIRCVNEISEEVVGIITLPEDWKRHRQLVITAAHQGNVTNTCKVSAKKLGRLEQEICYYIENCHREGMEVTVTGWAMAECPVTPMLVSGAGMPFPQELTRYHRRDLLSVFPETDEKDQPGFLVRAQVFGSREGMLFLEFRIGDRVGSIRLQKWDEGTKWQYAMGKAGDAFRYLERNGLSATWYKIKEKIRKKEGNTYERWREKYQTSAEELERQGREHLPNEPMFSIVVPLYQTPPGYLRELVASVQAQTYENWQLCLADGSESDGSAVLPGKSAGRAVENAGQPPEAAGGQPAGGAVESESLTSEAAGKAWEKAEQLPGNAGRAVENGGQPPEAAAGRRTALTGILEEFVKSDERICFRTLPQNLGISGNTNAAMEMAKGDFLVLADHDDLLAPDALYELADAINREPETDMIYSDEDKISMDGKTFFEPHFKPDFNPDLLCSVNYICHLFAARRDVAERAGSFRAEYEGAQDYDFILRCSECAKRIAHVPKILYHWRSHTDSTAANPESKRYAFEAGRRAIEAHYKRRGIPARVEHASFYGMYRTVYEWEEEPLVSVIIPNKDHAADLKKCLDSIYNTSEYRNFECVIVENNSTEPETFEYYRTLEAEHDNLRVVHYEGGFNFSKISNFGAAAAKGAYFLLLNNDTEMIDGGCIRELLGYCMREDVGAVGAKLLYEDGTIQHAGVILGFGGTAGHAFIGKSRSDTGYFGRILCAQNYSAVTAACMMTKRSVFEAVGGLTGELAVAFNDVDYCLKVREYGKLVVYDPYAELFHYESRSRGYEDSPEKVERFNGETKILLDRWREVIEAGDPCYNRNLTLDNSDFSLRR